jgi:hypothetical protein
MRPIRDKTIAKLAASAERSHTSRSPRDKLEKLEKQFEERVAKIPFNQNIFEDETIIRLVKERDETLAKRAQAAQRRRIEEEEAQNLDALDPSDLDLIATTNRGNATYRRYAKLKAQAMRYRMAGNIQHASVLEDELERLYEKLPTHLQW